jgi:5'-3' exoribonuclease 1
MKLKSKYNINKTKMGIKHFFHWYKNKFAEHIFNMRKGETFADLAEECILDDGIVVDNFMIDLNGLFHGSAQKIYEYGNCKPQRRLLGRRRQQFQGGLKKQLALFKDVCDDIDKLFNIVKPRKRLILCVDGPAPLSKQAQQRQRRFRAAMEKDDAEMKKFDSNCITPGTKFMDFLSKYIDWYVRKKMSQDPRWQQLEEVVFSNEKAPGEGEHKIINFIRKFGGREESYCIHGMDADLIMLSMGTHMPHFYILREDLFDPNYEYFALDIGSARKTLAELMLWNGVAKGKVFDPESAVNDFIFMCFTVGNDFLPHIPGIEIIEGGIDFMLDVYKNVCESYGHLTKKTKRGIRFRKKALSVFMGTIAQYEKGTLQEKLDHKANFFPDPILEANATLEDGKYDLDIEQYREDYYSANLPEVKDMQALCDEYLEGMQWVLSYYTQGVPNWKWRYPYHYAPFAHTLAKHVKTFNFPVYGSTSPTVPFVQLLSVLPPKSNALIPRPLNRLLTDEKSSLAQYCPEDFGIDLSGKRREWEGIVLLPMVDYTVIEKEYFQLVRNVEQREQKRNVLGRSFIYTYSETNSFNFRSYYGDFTCKVRTRAIDL